MEKSNPLCLVIKGSDKEVLIYKQIDVIILGDDCITMEFNHQMLEIKYIGSKSKENWKEEIEAHNKAVEKYKYKPSKEEIEEWRNNQWN